MRELYMFEWGGKNGCESGVCNLCLHKNHIPRFHRGRHEMPAVFPPHEFIQLPNCFIPHRSQHMDSNFQSGP